MTEIKTGDALTVLRTMADESVRCCVTSPPYWGLRDYGTAKWEGGAGECDHLMPPNGVRDKGRNREASGAYRVDSQLGLEPTPEKYVSRMVEVFREVRRVLRKDGTLWLNLGDSYCSGGRATWRSGASENKGQDIQNDMPRPAQPDGLKAKDLIGIPWRVAFALQADGWYLRSDIIWSKPNPMPESVTDRPTKAHEYLFLLAKSERYYYDADVIREPLSETTLERWSDSPPRYAGAEEYFNKRDGGEHKNQLGNTGLPPSGNRNKRSVWTINTQPFPEAHFATFPEDLVRPCILAGCPPGGTVLDPFGRSGTVGLVAKALGCNAILIELNPEYCRMAEKRLAQEVLPLV